MVTVCYNVLSLITNVIAWTINRKGLVLGTWIGMSLRVEKPYILVWTAEIVMKTAWRRMGYANKYYESCEIESPRLEWIRWREKIDFRNNRDISRIDWRCFEITYCSVPRRTHKLSAILSAVVFVETLGVFTGFRPKNGNRRRLNDPGFWR